MSKFRSCRDRWLIFKITAQTARSTIFPAAGARYGRTKMTLIGSGIICVTMFAVGFFLVPMSSLIGDVANIGGIVSAVVFVGLLDGQ